MSQVIDSVRELAARGASLDAAAARERLRTELAAYKVPTAIEFRDDLPKSAALKTLRRVLRDEVVPDA